MPRKFYTTSSPSTPSQSKVATSKISLIRRFLVPQPGLLIPNLSSLLRAILALSPGNGFISSFGSREVPVAFWLVLESGLFSLRESSKAAMSSAVMVMAVGLRRSIVEEGLGFVMGGRCWGGVEGVEA